jgi:ribosomal protein L37AE/L43A
MPESKQESGWDNKFCPDCGTQQVSTKLKNGNWKCSICGREFSEDESSDAENTQIEEEEIF